MLSAYLVVFLFFYHVTSTSVHEERRQIIERVRNYLQKSNVKPKGLSTAYGELENSNKIGFGYNLISGSPTCYTSKCQMAGFTHSVFKLNYTLPVAGSCTNKLIPENVELDCLPWMSVNNRSEMIDTIEQLYESISSRVDVSIGARYKAIGFSYGYSRETQHMLDTIVKNQEISLVSSSITRIQSKTHDSFLDHQSRNFLRQVIDVRLKNGFIGQF